MKKAKMMPKITQLDENLRQRERMLAKLREQYRYDLKTLAPVPVMTKLPRREKFSLKYLLRRTATFLDLPLNIVVNFITSPWRTLQTPRDYRKLMPVVPKPALIEYFLTDWFFGEQRLSGANPMAICRLTKWPDNFDLDLEVFSKLTGGEQPEILLAEGRLYFLEFPNINLIKGGKYRRWRKFMPKPRALFYLQGDQEVAEKVRLLPVAIEVESDSGANRLMFSPLDASNDWLFAKFCVQVADATYQELGTHFSYNHAVMAPFAISGARQLSERHPISVLLAPHFRFMLADNLLGIRFFLNPGGPVDRFCAGTLNESLAFVVATYQTWSIDSAVFPDEIASRGMDSTETTPRYPFRDDGLLLWDEIDRFVGEYLSLYYPDDETIRNDGELQAWAGELSSKEGGNVKGMPANIENISQLRKILNVIIFTCGPLHSSLNFPQYDYMGFVANMPYAVYEPVPEKKGISNEMLQKFLPPDCLARDQLNWSKILTSYHHDQLGDYADEFDDPAAKMVVLQFRQNLNSIERIIDQRNQKRPLPYPFLKPSNIINSVNT